MNKVEESLMKTAIITILAGFCLAWGLITITQAEATEKRTLEQRVVTLEKELKKLKNSIQRGTYRMGEIDADIREIRAKDEEQDARLARGKRWMIELQESYVSLLDRIEKHHPSKRRKR